MAGLGNPHVVAVAALFSPLDPYRELFYPGGCATSGRFARWMYESQIKDGVVGAVERLSELTGLPAEKLMLPPPVKPVDGPDGPALLEAAIDDHQRNVDMHKLWGQAPFSDDRLAGLDWEATTPGAARQKIEATGVPMLVRAGWLDAAFAAGALRRFATFANHQEVEIGPGATAAVLSLTRSGQMGRWMVSCFPPRAKTAGWWSSSLGTSSGAKPPMAATT